MVREMQGRELAHSQRLAEGPQATPAAASRTWRNQRRAFSPRASGKDGGPVRPTPDPRPPEPQDSELWGLKPRTYANS